MSQKVVYIIYLYRSTRKSVVLFCFGFSVPSCGIYQVRARFRSHAVSPALQDGVVAKCPDEDVSLGVSHRRTRRESRFSVRLCYVGPGGAFDNIVLVRAGEP